MIKDISLTFVPDCILNEVFEFCEVVARFKNKEIVEFRFKTVEEILK